jgi:Thioredoxin domain-containing protein
MGITKITDENFEEKVMKSPNVWCLRFTAEWCGTCKQLVFIVE